MARHPVREAVWEAAQEPTRARLLELEEQAKLEEQAERGEQAELADHQAELAARAESATPPA
jgi:hypothetical protein